MKTDNALANLCTSLEMRRGGDTGRRRAEHRSFLLLWFTHHLLLDTVHNPFLQFQGLFIQPDIKRVDIVCVRYIEPKFLSIRS